MQNNEYCKHCGGFIINTGIVLTSLPPIYVYKCKDCNKEVKIREQQ